RAVWGEAGRERRAHRLQRGRPAVLRRRRRRRVVQIEIFPLPIGHAGLSAAHDRFVADLRRDRVERYPGFDRGEFETFTDEELDAMARQITAACCPPLTSTGASAASTSLPAGRAWTTGAHYIT